MLMRIAAVMTIAGTAACGSGQTSDELTPPAPAAAPPTRAAAGLSAAPTTDRKYLLERVGDAAVVQLYADAFHELPLQEKTLVWHLYQAALAGRDIYYDQKYAHNLEMRDLLEAIITHPAGVNPDTL